MLATGYALSTTTQLSFTEAVGRVRAELTKEGFGVLCEIDVHATLKAKLDVDGDPYLILGACNPALAHQALSADPEIGLLLRATAEGVITHSLVSGRVLYHERIRDALLRHIEKDLGPLAMPRVPLAPQPFTVAEYFPTPGVTPFHDPRQHAVSLAYVVPISGDCHPQRDAIDLAWVTPEEAVRLAVVGDMESGHGVLVRQALAHLGHAL